MGWTQVPNCSRFAPSNTGVAVSLKMGCAQWQIQSANPGTQEEWQNGGRLINCVNDESQVHKDAYGMFILDGLFV